MSDHLALPEAARLVALWRLAAGAAHATNNALTSILGEASYLRDEWKGDAQIVACCDAIMAEVDRCARLTRALLSRREASSSGDEVDLGRTLRELSELLPDMLGRSYQLEVDAGSELRVVAGGADRIELLLLTLVQAACALSGGTARLELGLGPGATPDRAALRLAAHSPELPGDAVARVRDPGSISDSSLRTLLLAAHEISGALGSELRCESAPGRLAIRLELSLVAAG